MAMRQAELNPEIIETTCVMYYAKKYIPGVSRSIRKPLLSSSSVSSEMEQKEILESRNSCFKSSTGENFEFIDGDKVFFRIAANGEHTER
ncbi:BTB/POZ domain-containing protein [Trifolium pratense]|uniref:Uncharacterized protein n=2 Tax=Trifolium pratense TaxID=57577 RepID=A0ACB0IDY4_TRIPR|nr:BTB/POZ domain-containing protein [Trifolium pratense]CAJ2630185.1 unnamed protein product [Trifolium pratense]